MKQKIKAVSAAHPRESEIPLTLRNPMSSTFLQRVLLHYQILPDGHPYNAAEVKLSPEDLKKLERMSMMPESQKVCQIQERDTRWDRGLQED